MRKLLFTLAAVLLFSGLLLAQKTLTGRVADEKGNPVPNASVIVKGSTTGTVTKPDGTFSLVVPTDAKALIVSSVDMGTQEQPIGSNTVLNFTLKQEDKIVSEVVVVGYGTQRRKDVTASIATISGNDIKNIPAQSFEQALAGKAAGLNIVVPNAVLNNPPVVRIRGANSITGSTFPLVVIDGVPVFTGDISTNNSANNVLGNLNPQDIEDIQILKDAAAAAIYGSRAANGVMLVTTKKGKTGRARVTYDAWVGWSKAFRLYDILDANQYVLLKNEAVKNLNAVVVTGVPAGNPIFFLDTLNGRQVNTNWLDEVYQTGFQQNHTMSISGANEATRYYFSVNFTKQEGILQTNEFNRKQARVNIDHKVNKWLKVGGNFNISRGNTKSPNSGSLPGTPFATSGSARLAFVTAPNVSPYLPDGRYNIIGIDNQAQRNSFNQIGRNKNLFNSGLTNPTLVRDLNKISSQSDQLLGDVFADITLMKNLTYRTQYGVNYQSVDDRTFYNALNGDGIQTTSIADDGLAFNTLGKYNIVNWQNTLNYLFTLNNKHNFTVLLGTEEQKATTDRWGAQRSGLSEAYYNEYQGNFTINDNPPNNLISENYLLSFFGRVNYNFANRYYISANIRRDGYSAFADSQKWGTFAGGSVGWNISDEEFYKSSKLSGVLNSLKLRASFGEVGNISGLGNFASLSLFGSGQYGLGNPTLAFVQAGNPALKWESSTKFDVGIQFGLFNNRLTGDFGYYNTDLSDLILAVPTPPSMGIPGNSIPANAAEMFNRGIELNLTAEIMRKKDFSWSASFNLTTQKNEVTKLTSVVPEIVGNTQLERTNITRVGYPIGSFFMVRSGGVDPATGRRIFINAAGQNVYFDFASPSASRYKFADGSNAPAIDLSKDGYIAGNALPTVYGGLSTNARYKNFDIAVDAFYSFGNKVYFGSRAGLLDQRFWNNDVEVLTRWQKPGDITEIPRVVFNDNISNGSAFPIDANLYDGGFVKFRSIALGYSVPLNLVQKINIASIRFYAQVTNPFMITNYPGSDPEISVNGNSPLTPGVDRNTIGQARTWSVGFNVGF
jgi:TonB-dependent starch-binding outer membrane protein SusC